MEKKQLFCIHFAGGNCYSFDFIKPSLTDFEVVTIELPGRGRRMNEPLLKDFDLAAKDVYNQIDQRITSSTFYLYGHSLGAYLALRTAAMLEAGKKKPAYLFVSGNPGPGLPPEKPEKRRHLLNDEDFKDELKLLGGIPQEVLDHNDLFEYIEPILRSDFELIEGVDLSNEPTVEAPIFAMMGDTEDRTGDINNWARFTTSKFSFEIMPGNHFFIHKNAHRIASQFRKLPTYHDSQARAASM